jgi:signal transduction histidine kinase
MYAVSHDLRAPLRRIDGFSQELISDYTDKLDDTGVHYLNRIRQGVQDMGILIDDLLKLSRLSRRKVELETFNLDEIADIHRKEIIYYSGIY